MSIVVDYETSSNINNRILGIIPRVGREKSREVSAIVLGAVENYNKYDKGSTLTYKFNLAASAKILLGIHGNLEVGVNLNYYHYNVLRKK